jgi:hypothetical protein
MSVRHVTQDPSLEPSDDSAEICPEERVDLGNAENNNLEDIEELLEEDESILTGDDVDEVEIQLEAEELETMAKENPEDLLRDPRLLAEISEDPVRLYLKEIGNIDLLTSDQEFWLATRLESIRRIEVLSRQHPLARGDLSIDRSSVSTPKQKSLSIKDPESAQRVYFALYEDLKTCWSRVVQDTKRLKYQCPDPLLMIREAGQRTVGNRPIVEWDRPDSVYCVSLSLYDPRIGR